MFFVHCLDCGRTSYVSIDDPCGHCGSYNTYEPSAEEAEELEGG